MSPRGRRIAVRVLALLLMGAVLNVAAAWGCSWLVSPRFVRAEPTSALEFWPHWDITAESFFENHAMYELQPVSRFKGFGVTECAIFAVPFKNLPKSPASKQRMFESDIQQKVAADLSEQLNRAHRENNRANIAAKDLDLRAQLLEIRTAPGLPPVLRTDAGWPMRSLRGWGPATEFTRPAPNANAVAVPLKGEWAMVVVRNGHPRVLPLQPLWLGFAVNTLVYALTIGLVVLSCRAIRSRSRTWRGLCANCGYPIGASERCSECGEAIASPSSH